MSHSRAHAAFLLWLPVVVVVGIWHALKVLLHFRANTHVHTHTNTQQHTHRERQRHSVKFIDSCRANKRLRQRTQSSLATVFIFIPQQQASASEIAC